MNLSHWRLVFVLVSMTLASGSTAAQVCGDCDGDGDVDISDALRAAVLSFGQLSPTVEERLRCDPDSSGNVSVIDALLIAQSSVGLAVSLNCLSPRSWRLVQRSGIFPMYGFSSMVYDPIRNVMVLLLRWHGSHNRIFEWDGLNWNERAVDLDGPNFSFPLIYDSVRQVCLVLDTFASIVWTWDGIAWQSFAAPGPAQRYISTAAFDSTRGVAVIHGGSGPGGQIFHDTWEWDGASWREVVTAIVPPDGFCSVMAFDPVRGLTVLYGCSYSTWPFPIPRETYEFDGANWMLSPAPSLLQSSGTPSLFWDPQSARIMLLGLDSSNAMSIWSYDGASWVHLSSTSMPQVRVLQIAGFDPSREVLMLFGGQTLAPDDCQLGDTWEWDRASWRQVNDLATPVARNNMVMSHHRASGKTLMTGGTNFSCFASTCTWDGATWALEPSGAIDPRVDGGSALVYDSDREVCVLFGGLSETTITNETWEWDGVSWTRVFPAVSPMPRLDHAMAYDEARGEVVLFGGGFEISEEHRDETWTYDGATWTLKLPATKPPRLSHAVMSYHVPRAEVVLFGGIESDFLERNRDTYIWNGVDWRLVPLTTRPSTVLGGAMTYDESHRTLVLACGYSPALAVHPTWEWDGATWARITSSQPPASKEGMGMTYDSVRDSVIFYGGMRPSGGALPELWEYR